MSEESQEFDSDFMEYVRERKKNKRGGIKWNV